MFALQERIYAQQEANLYEEARIENLLRIHLSSRSSIEARQEKQIYIRRGRVGEGMNNIPLPIMYLQAKLAAAEDMQKRAEAKNDERLAARWARGVWKLKREIYLRTQRRKK